MARKLAPARRTRDGQPIKTTDVARAPTGTRPRTGASAPTPAHAGDRTPKRARGRAGTCAYPDCVCEEDD